MSEVADAGIVSFFCLRGDSNLLSRDVNLITARDPAGVACDQFDRFCRVEFFDRLMPVFSVQQFGHGLLLLSMQSCITTETKVFSSLAEDGP
jgi:hypothetical protein